jgi:hypothetical protein
MHAMVHIILFPMPSIAQSSPPRSPRSHTPPLQLEFKETDELDGNTYHTQQQALQEWFFASNPGERPDRLLRTLHRHTLVQGLIVLHQRMRDLVNLDLELYHKYACLLSDREVAECVCLYMACCLPSVPAEVLEGSTRTYLEFLIRQKVTEYDDIAKSVRRWKTNVDNRIGLKQNLKRWDSNL